MPWESLVGQTFSNWEAIVVDDGSEDATLMRASELIGDDRRGRIVQQRNGGPSAARNRGIAEARGEYLLFLDADDELMPGALSALVEQAEREPAASWWYGGWRRSVADGHGVEHAAERFDDAQARIAVGCPFAIHACLVRTSAVRAVGGFDDGLRTCEDWDLWRKLAAAGFAPRPVDTIVAKYAMRPASASSDLDRLLADGFEVIRRAHQGADATAEAVARGAFALYVAGIRVGRGEAPFTASRALDDAALYDADPALTASFLHTAIPLGAGVELDDWPTAISPQIQNAVRELVALAEARWQAAGFAERTLRRLESLIAGSARPLGAPTPLLGGMVIDIDLHGGVPTDLTLPRGVDRVQVRGTVAGRMVASTELAVPGGEVVHANTLIEGLLDGAAWPLTEACVLEPLFAELDVVRQPDGAIEVMRRGVLLGTVDHEHPSTRAVLNAVGWPLFTQELFGEPDAAPGSFYDVRARFSHGRRRAGRAVTVELADLPTIWTGRGHLHVDVRCAGMPFDTLVLRPHLGRVTAARLRAQVTLRNGAGLARAAMRAWLAAPRRPATRLADVLASSPADPADLNGSEVLVGLSADTAPYSARLNRRVFAASAGRAVLDAGTAFGRPVLLDGADAVALTSLAVHDATSPANEARTLPRQSSTRRSASSFDALFASADDPWAYTSDYEQLKYEQTLSLVPDGVDRALEVACAEGHFTVQLAQRVATLKATDVSPLALERAAARCAGLGNVEFAVHDLFTTPIPERWPLIVCSEVLYYAGGEADLARVVGWLVDALAPDGVLVTAHANLVVDRPDEPGFDWAEQYGGARIEEELLATGRVVLEEQILTPMYRVQRYRKGGGSVSTPQTVYADPARNLPPDVAAHFLPNGGTPLAARRPDRSVALPVLMYHRVSPTGAASMRRWRVTPEEFAAQLDYITAAGYSAITPQQWRDASLLGADLPDRPILLSFDDGYQDFADHAFPALQERGMTAAVMLVTDLVGQTNAWDRHKEEAPLMDWPTIRRLAAEGIAFGAHTASHPPLTSVSAARALDEVSRSVVAVARELAAPPAAFAYPYGDVTPGVRGLVAALSVDVALSCVPGVASPKGDLLMVPRIEVRGDRPWREVIAQLATA